MQVILALASRGQREKGFAQRGIAIQAPLEFLGIDEIGTLLEFDPGARTLGLDGLLHISPDGRLHLRDLGRRGESHLALRLRFLAGLHEDVLRVVQQRALDEQQRAGLLERHDQDDIGAVQGIGRLAPFQFLGQVAIEQYLAQSGDLGLPVLRLGEPGVEGGIGWAHLESPCEGLSRSGRLYLENRLTIRSEYQSAICSTSVARVRKSAATSPQSRSKSASLASGRRSTTKAIRLPSPVGVTRNALCTMRPSGSVTS